MITAIIPVYHNEEALYRNIRSLTLQNQITEIVLVFDGYRHKESFYSIRNNTAIKCISIYPDIPWGNSRARNIGAINSDNDFLLFMDVDRIFKENYTFDLNPDTVYRFKINLEKIIYHPNVMMMHKDVFFGVGGYDERFCGNYGYEDRWLEYLLIKSGYKFVNSENELIVLDSGGVHMDRDKTVNKLLFDKLIDELNGAKKATT